MFQAMHKKVWVLHDIYWTSHYFHNGILSLKLLIATTTEENKHSPTDFGLTLATKWFYIVTLIICNCGGAPPYGHLANTVNSSLRPLLTRRKPKHFLTLIRPTLYSEMPTCVVLYYFTPFIRPLKPVMLLFPLLIFYVLYYVQVRPVMRFTLYTVNTAKF